MLHAAVAQLKAALSEFLAHVKAGEELVVTERGKPIARIVPVRREGPTTDPNLLELERAGLARIGTGRLPAGFWELPRPKDPAGAALQALADERRTSR